MRLNREVLCFPARLDFFCSCGTIKAKVMRKYLLFLTLIFAMLVFSGCSLLPTMSGNKSTVTTPQTKKGSIWKSVDGGATFEPKIALEAIPPENNNQKRATPAKEITTADILAISFNPNDSNVIYAGTKNDGIFKTSNGGDTWTAIKFPPQKIYSFTMDRKDPDKRMFASGALYNIGKIFRTDDGGDNWKEVYSEPGAGTLVTSMSQHNVDTNVIFAGTSGGTVIKSTDGGQTWKNIGQTIDGPVTEIPFDATKKLSVYALSYKKKVYYSSNGGEIWIDWEEKKKEELKTLEDRESELRREKRMGEADSLKNQIEALKKRMQEEKMPQSIISLTASPFVSGVVYAGTQQGTLYRSLDYGKYWKQVNIIESASKFPIRMVATSYANQNELSFVSGTAFYKSLNDGATWAVTQLNVDRPVSVISYNPKDSNMIYLGLSADSQ